MGNQPGKESENESQMISARHFDHQEEESVEPMSPVSELEADVQALEHSVDNLAQAINAIFEEDDDQDGPNFDIEEKLQGMTRTNQDLVLHLSTQLERHAKAVGNTGRQQNEVIMKLVIKTVTLVNKYMALLALNVKKLKRMISEIDANQLTFWNRNSNRKPLYLPTKKADRSKDLVYDVIGEHQDVDSMLLQLIDTRAQREELEGDVITVLVFWREYRYIRAVETDSNVIERIEGNVLAAADSVSKGMSHFSRKRDV